MFGLFGAVQAEAEAKAYEVTIVSENASGQAITEIVITVTGDTPPAEEATRTITLLQGLFTFVQGQRVDQQVFTADADIVNENVPPGLSLSARGRLTGTASAAPAAYVVDLSNEALAAEASFTIRILADEEVIIRSSDFIVFVEDNSESQALLFSVATPAFEPSTEQLSGWTVNRDITFSAWEFGQAQAIAGQEQYTFVHHRKPVWLGTPTDARPHTWNIVPSLVPADQQNKWNSFTIRAVRRDSRSVITRADQVTCHVFIQGAAPAPIPPVGSVFLEATLQAGSASQIDRLPRGLISKRVTFEMTVPAGVNPYRIYPQSVTRQVRSERSTVTYTPAGEWDVNLHYVQDEDGRYELTGATVTGRITKSGTAGHFPDGKVTLTGRLLDQDYPETAAFPAVSIAPGFHTTLNYDNREQTLAANRLYNQTRVLFDVLGRDLDDPSHLGYKITPLTDIPDNNLLVPPSAFATWTIKDDSTPAQGVHPNIIPARPATRYWIEFEAQPTIANLGRYNVELEVQRGVGWITGGTAGQIDFDSENWTQKAVATQLLRVGRNPAPAPTVDGFVSSYRIEINRFWESEPFTARNESSDPIEVTFPAAPIGFAVGPEEADGFRFNWTPTRAQVGRHEFDVIITAKPGVEGIGSGQRTLRLVITVVANRGHITQIENPSSIREFGEFFMRPPPFHNYQFLQYGLRSRHVVPPRTLLLSFPLDHQTNARWREFEPGRVFALNIFGVLERPTIFVVDKVTLQDSGFGEAYKRVWLTERRTQPAGWYKGTATQADGVFSDFDTLFTSNHEVELREEDDEYFVELPPSVREVLLVTVEDDGSAQAIITGNPIPFYPDNDIQLRIGDYVSSGPAEVTPTSLTWNGTTTVPTFGDTEEVIIEAIPDAVVPHIVAVEDDEEAIFEAGITFNGRLRTNPGVLRGRYLVIRHVNTLVAYNEATGELWDAESGVLLGTTITGQSAITSVRLEGRKRDSLLIRGSEDYELLL